MNALLEASKENLMLWIGALCTLGLYSILYRENKIYRFFEHMFLGLATGYLVANTWNDVLQPKWWEPFKWWMTPQPGGPSVGGQWWLIFVLVAGLFYYFIYTPKFAWLARLIIGFTLGVTSGRAFQAFVNDLWPQIPRSFKPFVPHGEITTAAGDKIAALGWSSALNNLIFMLILFCVMSYFFFSFEQRHPVLKGSARLGRWLMMFTFGAIFGFTIMGRLALMIDRMDFLVNDFGGLLGGPSIGPWIMFVILIGLAGLILYLAKRSGASADEPGSA